MSLYPNYKNPVVYMANSKAARLAAATRRAQVADMIKAGATYRQMAAHFGVTIATIQKDVQANLKELHARTAKTTEEWRALELDRLDAIQLVYWQRGITPPADALGNRPPPDIEAAKMVLKVMERRHRLLGLDKPTETVAIPYQRLEFQIIALGMTPSAFFEAVMRELHEQHTASHTTGAIIIPE